MGPKVRNNKPTNPAGRGILPGRMDALKDFNSTMEVLV